MTISKIIEKELAQILKLIGIKAIIKTTEQENILMINLAPENEDDIRLLLGWHGQNLSALQNLLKVILSKKLGDNYKPFLIDAGDYRKKREEILKNIVQRTAEKVNISGRSITLDPMTSAERRIVHLALVDFSGITSESIGQGENRRIIIKKA
jgi:spoIIIJ-associated protein